MIVYPSTLRGKISPPPSKSVSHRALILAAMLGKGSSLCNLLESEDVLATKNCLESMGAGFSSNGDGCIMVENKPVYGSENLACKNSGTTLRLLSGIATLVEGTSILMGDDSLNSRPMLPLVEALRELGVSVEDTEGHAPIKIKSGRSNSDCHIQGSVSSQFVSSLIISAAFSGEKNTILVQKPIVSSPYMKLTTTMLEMAGIEIEIVESDDGILISIDGKKSSPTTYKIPADISSAAFFLSAGALKENSITVENIDNSLPQADSAIIHILEEMGANIHQTKSTVFSQGSELNAISINLGNSPDIFPILCVVGSLIKGKVEISGAHHLKFKESNRILTTCNFLKKMGADISATDDGATIFSSSLQGGCKINPSGDHRIAMAAAIAATFCEEPVIIDNPDCVAVSYPNFFKDLEKLSGNFEFIE